MVNQQRYADILTVAFGTTAAMWAGGYVSRMPSLMLPNYVILFYLVLCLFAGGVYAGRHCAGGVKSGMLSAIVISILNLLIFGSFITGDQPNQIVPSALFWLPGSMLFCLVTVTAGAWIGSRFKVADVESANWLSRFARVAVFITFMLLVAGGLVTSHQAGLAVVDWPNSYGYNMFLFPLARMTGGVYYEHSHRLLGSMVGLTTIVLAVLVQRSNAPKWLKQMGWAALALVIVQGIMGGLRVTGKFTLSQSPDETAPSIALAIVHGVTGQVFFCLMASIAAFCSTAWTSANAVNKTSATTDRRLSILLAIFMLIQLTLGAFLRHIEAVLMIHITMAFVVFALAIVCAARAWWINGGLKIMKTTGAALAVIVTVQVILGFGALAGILSTKNAGEPTTLDVLLTTLHQGTGALLFATVVLLAVWSQRLLKQV